jgi:hypothetical protein
LKYEFTTVQYPEHIEFGASDRVLSFSFHSDSTEFVLVDPCIDGDEDGTVEGTSSLDVDDVDALIRWLQFIRPMMARQDS